MADARILKRDDCQTYILLNEAMNYKTGLPYEIAIYLINNEKLDLYILNVLANCKTLIPYKVKDEIKPEYNNTDYDVIGLLEGNTLIFSENYPDPDYECNLCFIRADFEKVRQEYLGIKPSKRKADTDLDKLPQQARTTPYKIIRAFLNCETLDDLKSLQDAFRNGNPEPFNIEDKRTIIGYAESFRSWAQNQKK